MSEGACTPRMYIVHMSSASLGFMQAPSQILERGGALVKIPMSETHVRSLNLATSVGVGLYEVRFSTPCGG